LKLPTEQDKELVADFLFACMCQESIAANTKRTYLVNLVHYQKLASEQPTVCQQQQQRHVLGKSGLTYKKNGAKLFAALRNKKITCYLDIDEDGNVTSIEIGENESNAAAGLLHSSCTPLSQKDTRFGQE
jgi:hypothetical protein